MSKFVAHVDEISLTCTDAASGIQSALHGEVGLVGVVPEGINDEHIDIPCRLFGRGWQPGAIRVVGKKTAAVFFKDKSVSRHATVWQFDGNNIKTTEAEGTFYRLRIGADVIWKARGAIKSVLKNAREAGEGFRRPENRHAFVLQLAKAPQVVEAKNVVDMRMGVEDGINPSDVLPQALGAKIGCGINDEGKSLRFDLDRCAEALVTGVCGFADRAGASNHRNPV